MLQTKISLKWLAGITVVVLIMVFSLVTIFYLDPVLTSYLSVASLSEQSNVGLPTHLKIPKINVNAAIEYVSLTSSGAVGVPKGVANVAWFNLGPRPGQQGNSIIVGHFGWWKNGTPAIFNNLNKLKPGDKIYVQDDKGVTITFVVRELKIYDQHEDASGVFMLSDQKAHLNLITCDGTWDAIGKTYSSRLVVFTDKQ